MKEYPFPDEVSAREELKRDVLYHCIPERVCKENHVHGTGKEYQGDCGGRRGSGDNL